jgi:hypothetical protein
MKSISAALVAACVMITGAAVAQPAPYEPIPPPQVEAGPPPPIPGPPAGYVLEPGHWQWDGVRYAWVPRHWVVRQPGWAHWVPGHWFVGATGIYHWVPGHWGV